MHSLIYTVWNSLEVAKLITSSLTPIIVIFSGLFLNKKLKSFEHRQWRNQKLIEKRLEIYNELAPLLNDLLCYYTYVGGWKEYKPNEIVSLKRNVDKIIYLAAPLFCKEFFEACMNFMNLCYKSYNGWGEDAKLRTKFEKRQKSFGTEWETAWTSVFFIDNCPESNQIIKAYLEVMRIFSQEIGLQDDCFVTAGGTLQSTGS